MSSELHDSLFDLYMFGGLEAVKMGARGMKRELIIRLETSGLTYETGEIIHFYAVNRWDDDDEFDEWARPSIPMTPEAERIVGVTNEQLVKCRPSEVVLGDFMGFLSDGGTRWHWCQDR
jgi:DNA polymerase III epsilon subunit-like protein